jgi:hypothetical protein
MSQHDLNIANQGFPAFRADLNDALVALGSTNSGATAPATPYANQLWYDTANNILKIRNEDNDAWISIATLDQSGDLVALLVANTVNSVGDSTISGLKVGKGGGAVATNTAFGNGALNANTTGAFNTAVGLSALLNNAGASNNTAVGHQSLLTNTSGQYNTAVGEGALRVNTTANYNTALGWRAGYGTTTGDFNTFIGFNSGIAVTTGSANTIVGGYAGVSLTTGIGNSFLGSGTGGYGAGYLMTTGSNNTILGAYSGNQDGLNIVGSNKYVVISDGVGYRHLSSYDGGTLALATAVPVAGTGITFPATQSASANANTLDDYEEGTWSPVFSASGSITTQSGSGRYTKVGNMVIITANVTVSNWGTANGSVVVSGMPFTNADMLNATGDEAAVNGKSVVGRQNGLNATDFGLHYYDNAGLANTGGAGATFIFSATYRTTQ